MDDVMVTDAGLADADAALAGIAEAVTVSAKGHPQIDAPTPGDMQLAIAAAIRQRIPVKEQSNV